jgi:beta-galactosidase
MTQKKNWLLTLLTVAMLASCGKNHDNISKSWIDQAKTRETTEFLPRQNLMPIGVYYYPEHWNPDQWERDLKHIADLGFTFTHFGEFAWAMVEPEEGVFDFEWLDKVLDIADQNGLKVIMCTPTPTPPAWLTTNYSEVLTVNDMGIKHRHGSRLAHNGMNETYQYFAKRIVRKLGERYGHDERVWGWQLDNEPHFGGTLYDYSETNQQDFKKWLENKYGTINKLNKAWGTAFWSQVYNNFDQIRIPNPQEAPQGGNPNARLDFKRFNADQLATTIRYQANILKEVISPEQWITTNYAYYKFLPSVDIFRTKEDLDFTSHTMYLLSTYLNYPEGDLNFRLGSGMELSFSGELAKSVQGYTGIMELQPGQINWGAYNARPLPGAVRMWIWHTFGLGDRFTCAYRFRQPIYGGEMYHEGIVESDGVTVSHGGEEYVQTIQEINSLFDHYDETLEIPEDYASRNTAFMWKQDNIWDIINIPHNTRWDAFQHFYTYYENLKTIGSGVTFVEEIDELNPETHPFLIIPAYRLINDEIIAKWTNYAKAGGHIIMSCQTGKKDKKGHLWEQNLQEPVWNLIGAEVEFYDHLPHDKIGYIRMDGENYPWNMWGDVLIPFEDTEIWATHADQFYKGRAVVTHRNLGEGSVTYIGTWTQDGELERKIMRKIYQRAGAQILNQPRYVFTEWRDGFWVTVNYTSETIQAPVHKTANILFGKEDVAPGEVCVWIE